MFMCCNKLLFIKDILDEECKFNRKYICPYVQKEILQHVSDIQKEISQANKGILC